MDTTWKFLFVILFASPIVYAVSVEEDLTLTLSQKQALDKFKARVISKLPERWMKHEIYLIRFLRARNYDVNQATELILENVKWRKENKINEILKEDFSDLETDYKASTQSIDRTGRPVMMANFGDWDLRQIVATGRIKRIQRYIDKYNEETMVKIRNFQGQGKNVTQWDFIINMNNYNLRQHGCVPCIPFYTYLTDTYERHYPGYAHTIMLINTPPVFQVVLNAIKPFMSPLTRRVLEVYGQDGKQWKAELFKIVDPEQLPLEYGGFNTKIFEDDDALQK